MSFWLELIDKTGEKVFCLQMQIKLSLALLYLVDLFINKLKTKFNNLFYRMILNTKRIHNSFWRNFPARAKQMPSKVLFVDRKKRRPRPFVIKSQEPQGIPSATLKVTPSYFINKYKKKRPKEIPRDAWFPNLLVVLLAYTWTPKLEILVTILLLGAKLRERAESMKIKVKQAGRKIRVWKKTPCTKWVLNTRMFAWQGNSYPTMLCRQTNTASSKIFFKH